MNYRFIVVFVYQTLDVINIYLGVFSARLPIQIISHQNYFESQIKFTGES